MDVHWGPLTTHDAAAWAELAEAVEAADGTGGHHTAEQMAERLANPLLDLAEGTLAARQGGRLVAVGVAPVRPTADPKHLMELWGGAVHPSFRGRGYGRRILDWAITTAPVLHARRHPGKPLHLHLPVDETNHDLARLAGSVGFAPVRRFHSMRRSLDGPVSPPKLPDGVTIAPWTPSLDPLAREVRNAAFRDHWGSSPHTEESWGRLITGTAAFRPEGSFLAVDEGRAVGCLMTHHRGVDTAWIQIIATVREWRGRGVASSLISHALASFQAQGYGTTALTVDADNETGAVAVYTRAGFEVFKTVTTYSMDLTPQTP
ncbi:GNAT family N-acetyltransferase [Nonomuraea sp. NPDC050556]|uniref:GNAT family N-acetyltransferase n=1 Tax=Nonomuraea sp. NPDC050556 TaxID=3364369 RepID=UPI00378CDB71